MGELASRTEGDQRQMAWRV